MAFSARGTRPRKALCHDMRFCEGWGGEADVTIETRELSALTALSWVDTIPGSAASTNREATIISTTMYVHIRGISMLYLVDVIVISRGEAL